MGSLLDKPDTTYLENESGSTEDDCTWGVSSMQGWRMEMEDAHIISPLQGYPGHCLYAVFDGHGGKNAAKYAADKGTGMVAVLLKLLATQSPAFDPEAAGAERVLGEVLRQAFLKVDEEMRRGFDQVPDERSGCTAIAVLVTPTHIITANAGDSRALLSRNSQNVPLSEDHKPWLEGEKKRIEDAGGCVSMKRVDGELAVSRSLGDFQFKMGDLPPENFRVTGNPDLNYQVRNPQQDQFLVLACDGIWDVMENDEVITEVMKYVEMGEANPMLMCEELMHTCLAKHSRDNMSVIVSLLPAGKTLIAPGKPGVAPIRAEREAAEKAAAEKEAAERGGGDAYEG